MLANSSQRRELNGFRQPRTYNNLRPDRAFGKQPIPQRAVQPPATYRLFPGQGGVRRTQDQGPGRGGQRRESPHSDRARYDVERLDVRADLEDGLPEPRRHLGQREVPKGRDADGADRDPGPALPCFASEVTVTVARVHPVQSHQVKAAPVQVGAFGVGERVVDGEAGDVLRERAPLEVREDVAVVPVRVVERGVPEVGGVVAYEERIEDEADGVGRIVGRGMHRPRGACGQGIGRLLGHAPVDVKRDGATHFVGESGSLCGEQVVGILPQRAPDEESEEGVRVTRARDVDVLTGDAGDEREPSPIDQCDVLQQSPSFLQWLWSFPELEEDELDELWGKVWQARLRTSLGGARSLKECRC